jgi:hypothetical protein
MAKSRRPFNPKVLRAHAAAALRPKLGPDTVVYRYTVFMPMEQIRPGSELLTVATADDLQNLQLTLIKHFGGVTLSASVPSLLGAGARDPRRPKRTLEINRHAHFTVYAAANRASDDYFRALQKELAAALAEGLILIERMEVVIL